MPTDQPAARLERANSVRLRLFAERAAQDDLKLARAIRIVQAALDMDLITIDDLLDKAA